MTVRAYTRSILLVGLWVLAVGGLLLHCRIHPVKDNYSNLVPLVSCLLSVLIVPILFCFRRSIAYGYVLNGFFVIIGTITMTHFSIAHWPKPATIQAVLLTTTLSDILILWARFFIGKALFDLEFFDYDAAKEIKGTTLRYPDMGWWLVHLVAVSVVYYLGHTLWR